MTAYYINMKYDVKYVVGIKNFGSESDYLVNSLSPVMDCLFESKLKPTFVKSMF